MDLESLVAPVRAAMTDAGALLVQLQHEVTPEEKSPGDLVSRADRAAQALLKERLVPLVPNVHFQGEEDAWRPWKRSQHCWLVDPLDGTRPYLSHSDEWGVMATLMLGERPVFGAVLLPNANRFYCAFEDGGLYVNGERTRVNRDRLGEGTIGMSNSSERVLERIGADGLLENRLVQGGYAAWEMTAVADGRLAGYLGISSKSRKEWDVAPLVILTEEAGGRVTDAQGQPLRFGKDSPLLPDVVISNGVAHDAMIRELREKGYKHS